MDINKCNIYFGNLKIKTIYFGPYKVYEDSQKRELTLLQLGTAIVIGNYIAPQTSTITGSELNLCKCGTAIITDTYIAPQYVTITGEPLSLLQFTEV